jgi:ADP-ribose pyrophosphatase YjhB (NUDIX family)
MIVLPQINYKQDSFCGYCGTYFTEQIKWPRKCFICWNESYKNPLPVVVVLIPVRRGLLIQQRGIMPGKGEWALPSGYINDKETYQQAAVREMKEEIYLDSKVEDYELFDVCSSVAGTLLIFAVYYRILPRMSDLNFVPNEEVLDIKTITAPEDLIFPTHTEMVKRYFDYLDK